MLVLLCLLPVAVFQTSCVAVLQELKETVNRLVTSACETFVSAPLLEGGKEMSPQGDGTPNSEGSPNLSLPSSSLDGRCSTQV